MGNVLCGLKKQTYSFDDINSNSSDHHGSVSQKPSAAEDLRIKSLSSSPRNIPLSPPTEQSHRVYATNAGVNNYPELCRTTPVKLAALNVIVDAADVMVRTADAMTRMANRHANAYRTFDDILLEGE